MQPDSWPAGTARARGAYRYRAYNWAQFRIIIRRHDFSNEESTTRLHGDSVSVQLTFDCYATAVARPSDTTAGPDRDQRDHLCPPTRAGGAALRGRTIIEQLRTPDGTRHAPPVTAASTGFLE